MPRSVLCRCHDSSTLFPEFLTLHECHDTHRWARVLFQPSRRCHTIIFLSLVCVPGNNKYPCRLRATNHHNHQGRPRPRQSRLSSIKWQPVFIDDSYHLLMILRKHKRDIPGHSGRVPIQLLQGGDRILCPNAVLGRRPHEMGTDKTMTGLYA